MPPRKKSRSSVPWSSGRAPAWVSERRSPAKRSGAVPKRSGSAKARKTSRSVARPSKAKRRKAAGSAQASSRAAPKRRTTRAAARTTRSARRPARPASRRRPAPRRRPAAESGTEAAIERAFLDVEQVLPSAGEVPVEQEPAIAIAGVTPATLVTEEAPAPVPEEELARRVEDWAMLALALLLAASTFLPWYTLPSPKISLTGWASGTWASLIFFLGAGAAVLVTLRRFGVRIALPFPESIVLEAFGWVATLAGILKARVRPTAGEFGVKFGVGPGVWVAIGAALALALLAGRVSGKSPFVAVPGWYRGRAGKVGAAILLVIAAGSAAFGFTNSYKARSIQAGAGPGTPGAPTVVRNRIPDCARGFPIPSGVKPYTGSGGATTQPCVAIFQTTLKAAAVVSAFKQSLTAAHYAYTVSPGNRGATTFRLTSPRCGQLNIVAPQSGPVFVSLVLSACSGAPSP